MGFMENPENPIENPIEILYIYIIYKRDQGQGAQLRYSPGGRLSGMGAGPSRAMKIHENI